MSSDEMLCFSPSATVEHVIVDLRSVNFCADGSDRPVAVPLVPYGGIGVLCAFKSVKTGKIVKKAKRR
jgi:hypothetical protein